MAASNVPSYQVSLLIGEPLTASQPNESPTAALPPFDSEPTNAVFNSAVVAIVFPSKLNPFATSIPFTAVNVTFGSRK